MKAEAALVEGIGHIVAHITRIGEMAGFYTVLLAGDGAGVYRWMQGGFCIWGNVICAF
jgi:hypothetical protein